MRRLLLPFLICFLLFWLFGGAWWFAKIENSKQQLLEQKLSIAPSFTFSDGTFSIAVDDNVSFFQSSYDPNIPEKINTELLRLVDYLQQNGQKNIVLVGKYLPTESNSSSFDNLGIARAEALKSRLIRLGLEGHRISTRSQKVSQMDFKEGLVFGAVVFQMAVNGTHQ